MHRPSTKVGNQLVLDVLESYISGFHVTFVDAGHISSVPVAIQLLATGSSSALDACV